MIAKMEKNDPPQNQPQSVIRLIDRTVEEEDLKDQMGSIEEQKQIQVIYIVNCKLEKAVLETICRSQWWNSLYQITLAKSYMRSDGCKLLAQANIQGITFLNLHGNQLESHAVDNLCRASFKSLRILGLANNRLTNQAIKVILRAKLPKLEKLLLSKNCLNYVGLRSLVLSSFPDGDCLPMLDLSESGLTKNEEREVRSMLNSSHPSVKLKL